MNHCKDTEKSKFREIDGQAKQELIRMIQAEFPYYGLPNNALTEPASSLYHEHKMAELRKLFRLKEFSKKFTPEDFEQARNKTREKQGFPAENIQQRKRPFDLFVKDIINQGQWTTRAEVGQLWKQLSNDKKSKYEESSSRVKQQIADFEQNKLPQLLKDPNQFYWLLRVSITMIEVDPTFQASEAKKFLPTEQLDNYARLCEDKRLELELESFSDFEVF